MWKIALIAFLCFGADFVRAGRVPRDADADATECTGDDDCEAGLVCSGSACKCPEGEVRVGDKCLTAATESQNACDAHEQCKDLVGTVCASGKCVGVKGMGEPCNRSSECNTTLHLTCKDDQCACCPKSVEWNGVCLVKAVNVGDACTESIQCESVEAACVSGTCQTPGNSSESCTIENAVLVDGVCRCKDGYVEDGGTCLKVAEMGGECTATSQCEHVNGTCTDGVCMAVTMTAAAAPAAPAPILISSECSGDEECSAIENSACKEGVCRCRDMYVPSEDRSRCLPMARNAGDQCETDKQCSKVANGSCIDGKCVAVHAAGIGTRTNKSSSPFVTSAQIFITAITVAGSRAIFA